MKRIVMDLDETICSTVNGDYANSIPKPDVIERMREFKAQGFEIVISTSRNMRTYEGNVGKINANTLPIILGWLDKHKVPYDEIYTGKPWCGTDGFYVDDRALRPDEFVQLSVADIRKLVGIKR
ncbi:MULTISPECIES: HAD-IIIC family phosphatase [Comamonas]|uniref:HAD-IIIC family phosphatase n=1 Tax=Comamonas TaxID=283 RepID=UPI0012CDE9D8|nr:MULTISPECIES: HAD-IIIC family phosphatase [Comamonas]MPT12267.1 HAD-IIIC family phosphatase [Comamonas sp.]WKL15386.1 HAD-IIIC family phosphatase [Comamonas testosteroni]